MNKSIGQLSAIIPAAGFSSRMGRFKPLLEIGEKTVVERVVALYRAAGLTDISVVIGFRGEEIQSTLSSSGVRIVFNRDFEKGMFRSIQEGVRSLPPATQAFFIHPVDLPLIRVATIKALMRAFLENPAEIFYPCFNGHRGHPPLIDRALSGEITAWSQDGGLRTLLEKWKALAMDVPVADEGVLLDLDTPEDYFLLKAKLREEAVPSAAECRVLMEEIQSLPEPVIAHCRKVAAVARVLAEAMNRTGQGLDEKLVFGAALVHDIARGEEPHAQAGARVLEEWGFPRAAAIVRVHLDIEVNENEPVSEAEVVYLADKLVSGDERTDLEERFQEKMKKYGREPEIAATIRQRWNNARRIKTKIEKVMACSLESLLDHRFSGKEAAS